MAEVQVTVQIPEPLRNLGSLIDETIGDAQNEIALLGQRMVQDIIRKDGIIASGAYLNSISSRFEQSATTFSSVIESAVSYASVIEEGRRAGAKQPPVEAIADWMGRKGISGERGVAFVIARSIGRKGTPGKFVFKRAAEALEPKAVAAVLLALERATLKIQGQ